MSNVGCPTQEELAGFAAGILPRTAFDAIALHVENCVQCSDALECVDCDPFTAELNRLPKGDPEHEQPLAEELIAAALKAHDSADGDGQRDFPWRVGKFEILERLGSGSFGNVFRARDTELDRIVALKLLRAGTLASDEDLDRFLREARSAAKLRHPGIVTIFETGHTEDGAPFLVEELIRGETLAAWLTNHQSDARHAAELVAEIAHALAYAHGQGVIHRDLKPANIMLAPRSDGAPAPRMHADDGKGPDKSGHYEGFRPIIMDFGMAKRDAEDTAVTIEGQVLGTPAYMSPEQASGDSRQVDARSDIYSLGVVLYELLTGERPFHGNRRMLLLEVLEREPRPPRQLSDKVPRDLETICLKAMAKAPSRRYETAAEMAHDLRRFLRGEPILARRATVAERTWLWCQRNPIAASLLVAVSVGSTVGLWRLARLPSELVRQSALDSAAMQAEMLEKVNSLYSTEIVERLGHYDIRATADYASATEPAVPLPATFLTALGAYISESESGMQVRHFSDHPFRTRRDGGPQDEFEREALRRLQSEPDKPFYRFETSSAREPVLRFATARRMGASCVACHNQHPASTKRDWKVGDVRGVLEIVRPLKRDAERTRHSLRGTFSIVTVLCIGLWGLTVLILIRRGSRSARS